MKEELQRGNGEFKEEVRVIEQAEVAEEEVVEEVEVPRELPVVRLENRNAGERDEDDADVANDKEDDKMEVKWAKFVTSRLLDFEGPVCFYFLFQFSVC